MHKENGLTEVGVFAGAEPKKWETTFEIASQKCEEIKHTQTFEDEYAKICGLAGLIYEWGYISFREGQFYYCMQEVGKDHILPLEIKDIERTLELMQRDINEGNRDLYELFVALVGVEDRFIKQYIPNTEEDFLQFSQYLSEDNFIDYLDMMNVHWMNFSGDLQARFIQHAVKLPALYEGMVMPNIAAGIMDRPELLYILLITHPCPWEIYVQMVEDVDKHSHIHVQYLEKHREQLKGDSRVLKILKPKLSHQSVYMSKGLRRIFGYEHIEKKPLPYARRNYGNKAFRAMNIHTFSIEEIVACHAAGMDKEEYMGYVKRFEYSGGEVDFDRMYLETVAEHAPSDYRVCIDQWHRLAGLILKMLYRDLKGRKLTIEGFKKLVMFWDELKILDESIVQSELGRFFLVCGDTKFAGLMYKVLPRTDKLTAGKVGLLRKLIMESDSQIETCKATREVRDCALKHLGSHGKNEELFLLDTTVGGQEGRALIDFHQPYLEAVNYAQYGVAFNLIVDVRLPDIQSASVWFRKVKVYDLNVREVLAITPRYYITDVTSDVEILGESEKVLKALLDSHLGGVLHTSSTKYVWTIRDGITKTFLECIATLEELINGCNDKMAEYAGKEGVESEHLMAEQHLIQRVLQSMLRSLKKHESVEQEALNDRATLVKELDHIELRESEDKLEVLKALVGGQQTEVEKCIVDGESEASIGHLLSDKLVELHDIFLRTPKDYIDSLGLSDERVTTLKNQPFFSVLELLALAGYNRIVSKLIDQYGLPLTVKGIGVTALHMAMWRGNDDLVAKCLEHDEHLVSFGAYRSEVLQWITNHMDCVDAEAMIKKWQGLPEDVRKEEEVQVVCRALWQKKLGIGMANGGY